MNSTNTNTQNIHADPLSGSGQAFDFKLYLSKVKSNWYWFLLCLILCVLVSHIYIRYATPLYTTSASVLIKEDDNSPTGESGLLKAIGGDLAPVNNTETEAEVFKTHMLMDKVVKTLNSNVIYFVNGKVKNIEVTKTPFKIRLLGNYDARGSVQMDIKIHGTKITLSNKNFTKTVDLYQAFFIKGLGNMQVERGDAKAAPNTEYSFQIVPVATVVEAFLARLDVKIPSKTINIIQLGFTSYNPDKSEAILNSLIDAYIKQNILEKNMIADSTIAFIDKRLLLVKDELGEVEGNVESFKKKNKVTDIAAQSALLVASTGTSADNLSKVETQLNIVNSLLSYLANSDNKVMPSGVLLDDPNFTALVESYNTVVLEKERSKLSQTEGNPYVQNLTAQIGVVKGDMQRSLSSLKKTLMISRDVLQHTSNKVQGEVGSVPGKERAFLDLSRQQQIKQELYVFLLQKKEETAISKTSNISNCTVIDIPISIGPVSPNGKMIYAYGAIFGLFLPLAIMYLIELMNTKVQSKEDVASLTHVPLIAEVGASNSESTIVVSIDARTPVSEQFRNLRTNLNFFLKENQKKVLVTSSMSGEGKSFCSINLAAILALTGKKVVVMEMDLRKPNLSNKFNLPNTIGYTNYITDTKIQSTDIIRPSGLLENLFIISSGPIPPNPSELLINNRIHDLMAELERDFDYVIMDAPPVGLVTDAQLLSVHADLTLYVVRQGYTFKDQVAIAEDIFITKKIKNMAILLNDAKFHSSYGYGYGYYQEEEKSVGFFKRMFNK